MLHFNVQKEATEILYFARNPYRALFARIFEINLHRKYIYETLKQQAK